MRAALGCTLLACAMFAQVVQKDPNLASVHGTTPKADPSLYPASTKAYADRAIVAGDFMGHTINGAQTSFVADDYVVVEVAVYPAKGQTIDVRHSDFQLRVNEKRVMLPDTPQAVAASLKYLDWSTTHRAEVNVGLGDSDIAIGRPRSAARFPGDPDSRLPRRPPVQTPQNEAKIEPQDSTEAAVYSALPEGPTTAPVSGLLYFPYKGKLKALHSIEVLIGANSSAKPDVIGLK